MILPENVANGIAEYIMPNTLCPSLSPNLCIVTVGSIDATAPSTIIPKHTNTPQKYMLFRLKGRRTITSSYMKRRSKFTLLNEQKSREYAHGILISPFVSAAIAPIKERETSDVKYREPKVL